MNGYTVIPTRRLVNKSAMVAIIDNYSIWEIRKECAVYGNSSSLGDGKVCKEYKMCIKE